MPLLATTLEQQERSDERSPEERRDRRECAREHEQARLGRRDSREVDCDRAEGDPERDERRLRAEHEAEPERGEGGEQDAGEVHGTDVSDADPLERGMPAVPREPQGGDDEHPCERRHEHDVPPRGLAPAELLGSPFPDQVREVVDRRLEEDGGERDGMPSTAAKTSVRTYAAGVSSAAGGPSMGRSCHGARMRGADRSTKEDTALTSRICETVLQSASRSRGEQTSTARHCAREVATLNRWRSKAKPMPRGASSGVELAIETSTTGACWPWNLSTVPTATSAGSLLRSRRTWALYGATTRTSAGVSARAVPSASVNGDPTSAPTAPATASASSGDDWPAGVLDRHPDRPVPERDRARCRHRRVPEAPAVVRVGRERAELGPEAPRLGEEQPAVGRDGDVVAEQMLEHGSLGALGVRALRDLRELVRVAEQDQRAGTRPAASTSARASCPASSTKSTSSGRCTAWRSTASRVSAQAVPATSWNDGSAPTSTSSEVTTQRLAKNESARSSSVPRFAPREREALLVGLVLHGAEEVVDRLVTQRRHADALPERISAIAMRAPCHVLPEPGGPWTKR